MLEQDKIYLSKFAIDPEFDNDLDSYEIPEFNFGTDTDPDLDNIDDPDEDLWGDD